MKRINLKDYYLKNKISLNFLFRVGILLLFGFLIILIIKNIPDLKLRIVNSTIFFYYSKYFIVICHKLLLLLSYNNHVVLISQPTHEYVFEICVSNDKCLYLGWPCYGVKITAVFVVLIIAFPGKLLHKLWFIPIGMIFIQFFNILRFSILSIFLYHTSAQAIVNFDFLKIGIGYHKLFNFVLYILIFMTFAFWVRKFSAVSDLSRKKNNMELKEDNNIQEKK